MSFETINEPIPDFQVYVSRDSESEERPTIKVSLGNIAFSCTVDIINAPNDIELITESAGHDQTIDEINRLKQHAQRQVQKYVDDLREAYGEQHFS